MELNEQMIRDYLLRIIADANKQISRVLYYDAKNGGMRDSLELGMDHLTDFFTGGRFKDGMDDVVRYKEEKSGYSTYHFFDIPTLVSYSIYLNMIVDRMYMRARQNSRYATKDDFLRAQEEAKRYFIDHQRRRETCGFKVDSGFGKFTKISKGKRVLSPKKPLTWKEFDKKYDVDVAKRQLEQYIDNLFPIQEVETQQSQQSQQPSGQGGYEEYDLFSGTYRREMRRLEEEEISNGGTSIPNTTIPQSAKPVPDAVAYARNAHQKPEKFVYYYKKRKFVLEIISKEYYTDINGKGLTSIEAVGDNCRLMGTFYDYNHEGDYEEYKGNLYDLDGNFVNVDDGVMFFNRWSNPMKDVVAEGSHIDEMEDDGM